MRACLYASLERTHARAAPGVLAISLMLLPILRPCGRPHRDSKWRHDRAGVRAAVYGVPVCRHIPAKMRAWCTVVRTPSRSGFGRRLRSAPLFAGWLVTLLWGDPVGLDGWRVPLRWLLVVLFVG